MFDRGIPSICYGLRGLVYFQIDLRGTKSDLHSGSFGGAVANPAMVLAQILAQMKDRGGRIKIPGFYDDVRRAARRGARGVARSCRSTRRAIARSSARRSCSARAATRTLERVWGRPTFEVNGLLAGFTGEGAKTVIPAVAMAKVSMRLVPDQDPDKIAELFEDYVKKVAPKTVELKVTRMHGGKPWMTEFDNPFVQAAGRAIEKGFGKTPVFNREGGSIPVVATFQEILGPAVGALRRRPAGRERARAEREARSRQLPRRHHRVRVSSTTRSRKALTRVQDARAVSRVAPAAVAARATAGLCRSRARAAEGDDQAAYDKATGKLTELTYDATRTAASTPGPRWTATRPLRSRIDSNEDGKIDRWEYYDAGREAGEGRILAQGRTTSRTRGPSRARRPGRADGDLVDGRRGDDRSLGALRRTAC